MSIKIVVTGLPYHGYTRQKVYQIHIFRLYESVVKNKPSYFYVQTMYNTIRMSDFRLSDFMQCKREAIAYGTHKIFGLTRSTTV